MQSFFHFSTLFSYLTSAVTVVAAAANDSIVSFTRSAFTYANLFIAGAITGVLVGGFSLAEEVLSICITKIGLADFVMSVETLNTV